VGKVQVNKKVQLVQIGVIMIGGGTTKEEAELDAQTRPGMIDYKVFEGHVEIYGEYEAQPAPPIPA
jgi:hypothetical protein